MDAQQRPTSPHVALAIVALMQSAQAQQCIATAPAYSRPVTTVRDQGPTCNSCWAFATADAYEDNYYLQTGQRVDISEQQILSCSANGGNCAGGHLAFEYVKAHGVASEAGYPYRVQQSQVDACNVQKATSEFQARDTGLVDPAAPLPSVDKIKQAICQHGAVASLMVKTAEMDAYHVAGGVFNQPGASNILNHAVTIVGWDDAKQAWRIKNSMGSAWGDQGYLWIDYASNKIGSGAAWVEAKAPQRPNAPVLLIAK